MGNTNSNEELSFLKSSYSTLNLNRKYNLYTNTNKINRSSFNDNKTRRKKSASTTSLSSLGTKSLASVNNVKNLKWLYFGKLFKNIHFLLFFYILKINF